MREREREMYIGTCGGHALLCAERMVVGELLIGGELFLGKMILLCKIQGEW